MTDYKKIIEAMDVLFRDHEFATKKTFKDKVLIALEIVKGSNRWKFDPKTEELLSII